MVLFTRSTRKSASVTSVVFSKAFPTKLMHANNASTLSCGKVPSTSKRRMFARKTGTTQRVVLFGRRGTSNFGEAELTWYSECTIEDGAWYDSIALSSSTMQSSPANSCSRVQIVPEACSNSATSSLMRSRNLWRTMCSIEEAVLLFSYLESVQ